MRIQHAREPKRPRVIRGGARANGSQLPPVEAVLATSRDATVLIGAAGLIEYANAQATRILGYDRDALLQRAIFEMVHPDDLGTIRRLFLQLISEPGRTETGAFRFRHADGSWLWLAGTGSSELFKWGRDAVVAHFWERGTPSQPVEQRVSLESVEQQFRILVENAVHITAVVEIDGSIRYVSPVVDRMLGYTPESLKQVHIQDLVHADDIGPVLAALERRVQQPRGPRQFFQFRARHRDGSWRVLEAIATNRLDDPLIRGLVIDARDVTERNWSADRLRHSLDALLAIHDVGRLLGSSSEEAAIERALLEGAKRVANVTSAVLLLRRAGGRVMRSRVSDAGPLWEKSRAARVAALARQRALRTGEAQFFALERGERQEPGLAGWAVPLRVQGRVIGILEVHGSGLGTGTYNPELAILSDQAASALERTRLYQAVAERERRLGDLVQRLLLAAEEERRGVAFEIHDGLAQLAAATQQHLEGFAARYRTRSTRRRDDLAQALRLASETVREARHVIAGLRPTVLDDFGLGPALAYEIQTLRAEGWEVDYSDGLGQDRLDSSIETALFRVGQEALANVRKHAQTRRVAVRLGRRGDTVRLEVRDWGRGFRLKAAQAGAGPSERVGLAGMQERIALLSGRLSVQTRPGAGTRIRAEVPLRPPQRRTLTPQAS